MESALDVTSMFRRLRLWADPEPIITPPKSLPPLPMITYNKGFPGLPEDVIREILTLLDMESLKSCSLTGKAVSRSTKPFIHRTLYLTHRRRIDLHYWIPRDEKNVPGDWNEFKGLPILGGRGLLQHTRHLSMFLCRNPLFPHDLQRYVQHFQAFTNLRSLMTRWFDIPSFLPRVGEYFGAFSESLQSLELEYPRGDPQQILYFISQFVKLRDLRIKGVQDPTHSMRNGGPHFDINTFPPLNGTLDLEQYTATDRGAVLIVNHLATAPLKFRTLKLLGCTCRHAQLLIDACAANLEEMDFWYSIGEVQCPPLTFKSNTKFRKLELRIPQHADTELAARWLHGTLSTIASDEFTKLIIHVAHASSSFLKANESQVREWNSVDDVLDRLSLYEDVTLVVKLQERMTDDRLVGFIEKYFPLMSENGRTLLEAESYL